jgi:acyl CoA:acetate/3-ketoacid CoA transferase
VIASKATSGKTPEWSFSGRRRSIPLSNSDGRRLDVSKTIIAARALQGIQSAGLTNLGAGVGMYDVPALARRIDLNPESIDLTIEQGAFGGWPEPGGVAMNPECLLDAADVFDLYTGGGLDLSILSFGQVDRFGSVNVSRFGGMLIGSGGFIDIAQNARNLLFCGTFTAGADVVLENGAIHVRKEGRPLKFVSEVDHLTFNGNSKRNRAVSVRYVTERAVFELANGQLKLAELAPGIDIERDILRILPFQIEIPTTVATMNLNLAGSVLQQERPR